MSVKGNGWGGGTGLGLCRGFGMLGGIRWWKLGWEKRFGVWNGPG